MTFFIKLSLAFVEETQRPLACYSEANLDTNVKWINDEQHSITTKESIQKWSPVFNRCQVSRVKAGFDHSEQEHAGRVSGSDKLQLRLTVFFKPLMRRQLSKHCKINLKSEANSKWINFILLDEDPERDKTKPKGNFFFCTHQRLGVYYCCIKPFVDPERAAWSLINCLKWRQLSQCRMGLKTTRLKMGKSSGGVELERNYVTRPL